MATKPWQHVRNPGANFRPDPAILVDGQIALNTAAASAAVYFKDAAGDLAKVGSAQVSATAPNATPAGFAGNSAGEFWYDTTVSELKIWDGTAWASTGGVYVLPVATETVLGGIKVGTGLEVAPDGTLSLQLAVVELLGSADPTVAAPAATLGNAYIASVGGVADTSWTGIAGTTVKAGDILIYDGAKWIVNESASTSGVISVTGTAPITVGGTAADPLIGVAIATATATGVASFGDGLLIDAAGMVVLDADEGVYA